MVERFGYDPLISGIRLAGMRDIEAVWRRIQQLEGESFRQIRGAPFTYRMRSASLRLDRTNQSITKRQVAEALELMSVRNTVPLQHLRGPSYLFAILMDPRIRQGDW